MTTSDYINLLIAIITAIGIITSFVIAVKTLKQSSKQAQESREMSEKMLEESTRPYLYLFIRPVFNGGQYGRLVLKNFGASAAFIHSIKPPEIALFPQLENDDDASTFTNLKQSTFPPGYEVEASFDFDIRHNNPIYELEIEYSSGTKVYKDILNVNFWQGSGLYRAGTRKGGKYADYISESLQSIAQSMHSKI